MAALAVEHAAGTPVITGVGALSTEQVLGHVEDAQEAGSDAVLLAPVSYQKLTADDVYGLYEDVDRELSVPMVVYDNPGTTGFEFTDELYRPWRLCPRWRRSNCPGCRLIRVLLRSALPGCATASRRTSHSGCPGMPSVRLAWPRAAMGGSR